MRLAAVFVLACSLAPPAHSSGRLEGRVTQDGTGLVGVTVAVEGRVELALTGRDGAFALDDLPEGPQVLTVRFGRHEQRLPEVLVVSGSTTHVRVSVPWSETLEPAHESREALGAAEPLIAVPAGSSVVTRGEARREAGSAQVPRLLRDERSVQLPQSGLHDFHLNLRGVNEARNRRVLVLVDGRDASIPGLGTQEWLSFPVPLDELAGAEVIRGPASALHGSNALNGVVAFRTSALHERETGGTLRLALGERGHRRADLRQVLDLGHGWRARVLARLATERDFSRDRNMGVEYPGPFFERVARATDTTDSVLGGLRLDRVGPRGGRLVLEGALGESDGWMATTSLGRFQVLDASRSWGRLAYESERWSVQASQDARDGDHYSPLTRQRLLLDGRRFELEGRRRVELGGRRGRLLVGASLQRESLGSGQEAGRPTAVRDSSARSAALFGRWTVEPARALRIDLEARVDASDLHELQLSPRASLSWRPGEQHAFRLTLARGFRSPSLWETRLRLPVSGPVGFGDVEEILAPSLGGVPLHLDEVEALAVGNEALEVERSGSLELGYAGRLGRRVRLSVDYHRERVRDLVSHLVPAVGSSLGRVNPAYGSYRPPAELSPEQRQLVLEVLQSELPERVLAELSNDRDGRPILAKATFANVGDFDVQGLDLSLGVSLAEHWTVDLAYSWLEFEPRDPPPDVPFLPNAPENAASISVQHLRGPLDLRLSWRWIDGHDWLVGDLRDGRVPSHDLVDLSAGWEVSDGLSLGLDATNLLGRRHYQVWGGDLLERRAVAHATIRW